MKGNLSPEDIVAEFRRRRAAAWHGLRGWFAALVIGFTAAYAVGDLSSGAPWYRWAAGLACFVLVVACIAQITIVGRRLYRCPACEYVPLSWSTQFGFPLFAFRKMVDLNPATCGNCGVRLR